MAFLEGRKQELYFQLALSGVHVTLAMKWPNLIGCLHAIDKWFNQSTLKFFSDGSRCQMVPVVWQRVPT